MNVHKCGLANETHAHIITRCKFVRGFVSQVVQSGRSPIIFSTQGYIQINKPVIVWCENLSPNLVENGADVSYETASFYQGNWRVVSKSPQVRT